MTLTDTIRKAQADIITRLASCEQAISTLYAFFGHYFPDENNYWASLAKEEQNHAAYLNALLNILEKGYLFKNIGRFDAQAIQAIIDIATAAISKTREKGMTTNEAAALALQIESSLLDSGFYNIVETDAPEYRMIAKTLSKDTRRHIDKIQDRMMVLLNQAAGKSLEKRP